MITGMKRILLFNPPVGFFQRSEDRCQANMEGSTASSLRACNDLGYMAAIVRKFNYEAKISDYPAEKLSWQSYMQDLESFNPDIVIMSITTATIIKDMEAFKIAKTHNPNIITIAKGAYFLDCNPEDLNSETYKVMDYAISGEAEFILPELISAIAQNKPLNAVKGLLYWEQDKQVIVKTDYAGFIDNLDSIPFPARDLMNNSLYIRPDTGKPMATISVSRGCPAQCIYCLTSNVSGKRIRKRSAKNIVDELQECVEKHNISSFFFKADTFTMDKKWVKEVCDEVHKRNLKIDWGTTSRVKPLDKETLSIMKEAGCWLVAFGIESGNEDTLEKIKKGATKDEARTAVRWAKEVGLKVYGYYLIGFPWETKEHIRDTVNFAKELDCDYIEFQIAVPFEGTELYEMVKGTDLLKESVIGHDSLTNPVIKTHYLTTEELFKLKTQAVKEYYLRPAFVIRTLKNIKDFNEFANYTKYGLRMVKNLTSL